MGGSMMSLDSEASRYPCLEFQDVHACQPVRSLGLCLLFRLECSKSGHQHCQHFKSSSELAGL